MLSTFIVYFISSLLLCNKSPQNLLAWDDNHHLLTLFSGLHPLCSLASLQSAEHGVLNLGAFGLILS